MLFGSLRLPPALNAYPLDFFDYLPIFHGEDYVAADKHMEAFKNFIDDFEIIHEDVVMRLFCKSLVRDVAFWFKNLEADSISSWTKLSYAFLKYWGENKSLDQYWAEFIVLKRGDEEALAIFNGRFYNVYHSMPLEIRPSETAAMVYYVMAQHPDLVLLLRERQATSLQQLFEDAKEL